MYQRIPSIAITLNELRIYFPIMPPHSIPKAIPGFSVKWSWNHSVNTILSPNARFDLIHNFDAWSRKTRQIEMINGRRRALFTFVLTWLPCS
jgi:ABC-type arginine transport system permease subunit